MRSFFGINGLQAPISSIKVPSKDTSSDERHINTKSGVQNLDPNLTRVTKAFGATQLQTFLTVALPGSVPQIVSGLRVGIGQSLVGVIAAEMFVSTGGIGYFVAQSSANFNIDRVFVGIVVIIMVGMLITQSVK